MIQHVDPKWLSAAKRGARAAILTFISVPLASWFGLGTHDASGILAAYQAQWDGALGTALIMGLGAAGWRGILDPLPIPTLSDTQKPPPAA